MKLSLRLLCCTLVLSSVPSLASADEPSATEWAKGRVESGLVKPLAEKEENRFSRARPVPKERRTRITQASATPDRSGKQFLTFALDVKFGGEWHANDIVGCVYMKTGELYVKRGEEFRPAAFLLGKKAEPVAGVCTASEPPARS